MTKSVTTSPHCTGENECVAGRGGGGLEDRRQKTLVAKFSTRVRVVTTVQFIEKRHLVA